MEDFAAHFSESDDEEDEEDEPVEVYQRDSDRLRRNDPNKLKIYICLTEETDAEIAQALEQNDFRYQVVLNVIWSRRCRLATAVPCTYDAREFGRGRVIW